MEISNIVFEHLNKCVSILNLLDSKIRESEIKQISVKELKEKVSSPKDDFSLYISDETKKFIDETLSKEIFLKNPIILLTLSKDQAHKILKRHHFQYINNILGKDLMKERYFRKEHTTFLLANEAAFYVAQFLKNDQLINYVELCGEEIEERLKIINNHEISNILDKNPDLIELKKVFLVISEECDLRCSYCYEPSKRDKNTITLETAKEALRKISNGSIVSLFGGEPFLHIDLMKQIMNWGYEFKNFKFEISTNGQNLNRQFIRDYCKDIDFFQISVDGPEHVHDANRGNGSWKKAMEFYEAFYEETGWYPALSAVISKSSIPHLFETMKWTHKMRIEASRKSTRDSFAPWRAGFADFNLLEEQDFIELEKQWMMVKDWYLKEKMYKSPWSILAFKQAEIENVPQEKVYIPKVLRERILCWGGKTVYFINPDGSFVPCHYEQWLDKDSKSSDPVKSDEDFDRISTLGMIHLEDIKQCRECKGWGCNHCCGQWYIKNNDATTPDPKWCRANKALIKAAEQYGKELKECI